MRTLIPLFLFGCHNGSSTPPAINITLPNPGEDISAQPQNVADQQVAEIRETAMVYAKGVFSNENFDRFTKADRESRIFYRAAAQMIMCDKNESLSTDWNARKFPFVGDYKSLQITEIVAQEQQALVYIVEQVDGQTDESLIVSLRRLGKDWCVQSEVSTSLYLQ